VLTGEESPAPGGGYRIVNTKFLNLEFIKKHRPPRDELVVELRKLLIALIDRFGIKVVHGHNLHHFHPAPSIALEAIRREGALRVFHTFHETWPDVIQEERIYPLWNRNYAVSRHVQQGCRQAFGFTPDLFHLCVNTEVFASTRESLSSNSPPVILHPARLLPWKGVDLSVRALRLLIDRGYPATLLLTDTQKIADWNHELVAYRRNIASLVEELGLTPHVRFVRASYAEMPQLYERADIVVYPTLGAEPYGLVPVEAMSCGRPIIASRSGGIPETVIDGVTGYIVPVGDANALADRLAELISCPHLARRLGSAGRRHARNNFDAERYVSTILEDFSLP
jgi:glycosyltransferase involved in cell wall biosynthesis